MNGAPSQVDTFDSKPALEKYHGSAYQGATPVGSNGRPIGHLMKSPFPFARHGQSGLEISSLFPHTARFADDLCVIRSLYTDTAAHASGCLQMNTGSVRDRQAQPGLLAELRAGDREREPAQLRGDDRSARRPDLRRVQLDGRLHAGRLPGHAVPRQGLTAARPGHARRRRAPGPNGMRSI